MGKLEKTAVSIIAIILLLLTGAFVFQSMMTYRGSVVYRVSVLLENIPDDHISGLRHGMEQSAASYNIDLKFISVSGGDVSVLDRELENDVSAIVVSTFPGGAVATWLNNQNLNIPVISLDRATHAKNITAHVGAEEERIGTHLGTRIVVTNNMLAEDSVAIFTTDASHNSDRIATLMLRLSQSGIVPPIYYLDGINTIDFYLSNSDKQLLVSVDNSATEALCDYISQSEKLYRIIASDYTDKTLDYLESGRIECLVIQSQFELGYFGIENAYAAIQGEKISDIHLGVFVATQSNMYNEMAPILFPVY